MQNLLEQLSESTKLDLTIIESMIEESINHEHFHEGLSKLCDCAVDKIISKQVWISRLDDDDAS